MGHAEKPKLYDMHCHLDFSGDPAALAAGLGRTGVGGFWNTVTPQGYQASIGQMQRCNLANAGFAIGVGLHPWWLADGTCTANDVALAAELAQSTRYVGEIGLDFAPRREGTFDPQVKAFERVVDACKNGGKTLSVHAVRSASTVLDVFEKTGATAGNICVFHWFSGSNDELVRAVRLGCWFSLGTRSLATKRGRAYARAIPRDRLLLETDWPDDPGETASNEPTAAQWRAELQHATDLLAQALNLEPEPLAEQLALNSKTALWETN